MDMQSTDTKNETDKVCVIGAGSSGSAAVPRRAVQTSPPREPSIVARPKPQPEPRRRTARDAARFAVDVLAKQIAGKELASDARIGEACSARLGRQIDVAKIDQDVAAHALF